MAAGLAPPRDQRYKWAYLFGAICPARGVGAAWVLPHANIWSMNLHLQEISSQVALGAHAVVVLDGAGWHQIGERLSIPENISLLHLPAARCAPCGAMIPNSAQWPRMALTSMVRWRTKSSRVR